MFDFDNKIFEWCRERNLIYSRYADDIFVSAYEPDMLGNALVKLRELSSSFRYANLSINEDKTTFLSRRYKIAVCGLVLTPDNAVSIGLARKNSIKKDLYGVAKGSIGKSEFSKIIGTLSYIKDVEPAFFENLKRKYPKAIAQLNYSSG